MIYVTWMVPGPPNRRCCRLVAFAVLIIDTEQLLIWLARGFLIELSSIQNFFQIFSAYAVGRLIFRRAREAHMGINI